MQKFEFELNSKEALSLAAGVLARLGWALVFGVALTTLISSLA